MGLLRRTERGYALTELGRVVHEQVDEFESSVRTAYRLQPLAETFERAGVDFEFDLFRNAATTRPEPGNPYPFVDRTLELFGDSDTIRVVDCNPLVPPVYVERMLEIALETEMSGEFVVTEEIARGTLERFPELQREVAESDETGGEYRVHDDIPFGLALYDDHLDVRVYDAETGTPTLYADTDDSAALEWAEQVYEEYYEKSEPAASLEGFPDWAPSEGIQPERD